MIWRGPKSAVAGEYPETGKRDKSIKEVDAAFKKFKSRLTTDAPSPYRRRSK